MKSLLITLLFLFSLNLFALPIVEFVTDAQTVSIESEDVVLSLSLSRPFEKLVRVPFKIGGSAVYGVDHNLKNGEFVFTPGQKMAFVSFRRLSDGDEERELVVDLLAPMNASLGGNQTQHLYFSSEMFDIPEVSFKKKMIAVVEGNRFELTALLDRPANSVVIVPFSVREQGISKLQYNLEDRYFVFLPGDVSSTRSVSVFNNPSYQENANLYFTLQGGVQGATIGKKRTTQVTVRDLQAAKDILFNEVEESGFNPNKVGVTFTALGFNPSLADTVTFIFNSNKVPSGQVRVNGQEVTLNVPMNEGKNSLEIEIKKDSWTPETQDEIDQIEKEFFVGSKTAEVVLADNLSIGTIYYSLHSNPHITNTLSVTTSSFLLSNLPTSDEIDLLYISKSGEIAIGSIAKDAESFTLEGVENLSVAPFSGNPVDSLSGWNFSNSSERVVTNSEGEPVMRFSSDGSNQMMVSHSFVAEDSFFHTEVDLNIGSPSDRFRVLVVGRTSQAHFLFDKTGAELLEELGLSASGGSYPLSINLPVQKGEIVDYLVQIDPSSVRVKSAFRTTPSSIDQKAISTKKAILSSVIRDNIWELWSDRNNDEVRDENEKSYYPLKALSLIDSDSPLSQYEDGSNRLIVTFQTDKTFDPSSYTYQLIVSSGNFELPHSDPVKVSDTEYSITFSISNSLAIAIYAQNQINASIKFRVSANDEKKTEVYSNGIASLPILVRYHYKELALVGWHYDSDKVLTKELGGDTWVQPIYAEFLNHLLDRTIRYNGQIVGDISKQNGDLFDPHKEHQRGNDLDLSLPGIGDFDEGADKSRIEKFVKIFDDDLIDSTVVDYYIKLKDSEAEEELKSACTPARRYLFSRRTTKENVNNSHSNHFHLGLGVAPDHQIDLPTPELKFTKVSALQMSVEIQNLPPNTSAVFTFLTKEKTPILRAAGRSVVYNIKDAPESSATFIRAMIYQGDSCAEVDEVWRTVGCKKDDGSYEVGRELTPSGESRWFISDQAKIDASEISPRVTVCGGATIINSKILGEGLIDGSAVIKNSTFNGDHYTFGANSEVSEFQAFVDGAYLEIYWSSIYNTKIENSREGDFLIAESGIKNSLLVNYGSRKEIRKTGIEQSRFNDSSAAESKVVGSTVKSVMMQKSTVENSTVTSGELTESDVLSGSTVENFSFVLSKAVNAIIKRVSIMNSQIFDSLVEDSGLNWVKSYDHSEIRTSSLSDGTIKEQSKISRSEFKTFTIANKSILDNVTEGSNLNFTNSTAKNSKINGGKLFNTYLDGGTYSSIGSWNSTLINTRAQASNFASSYVNTAYAYYTDFDTSTAYLSSFGPSIIKFSTFNNCGVNVNEYVHIMTVIGEDLCGKNIWWNNPVNPDSQGCGPIPPKPEGAP